MLTMYTLHPIIKKDEVVSFFGERENIQLRINRQDFETAGILKSDPLHFHKESTQFFIVTEGVFRVKVAGDFVDVDKNALLEITPGTTYQDYEVLSAPCTCFTIGTYNNEKDTVVVEE